MDDPIVRYWEQHNVAVEKKQIHLPLSGFTPCYDLLIIFVFTSPGLWYLGSVLYPSL